MQFRRGPAEFCSTPANVCNETRCLVRGRISCSLNFRTPRITRGTTGRASRLERGLHDAGRATLVAGLPYLEETDGRVESIEYSERHGHVRDDRPRPDAEELQMIGTHAGPRLLQRVHRPQSDVDDDQEGDQLLAGFVVPRATSSPRDLENYGKLKALEEND